MFFFNYAIFQASIVIGIVVLVVELIIYTRIKGGAFGRRFHSPRVRTNKRETAENSNATLLILELMKMERIQPPQPEKSSYQRTEEHATLRKAFER